MMESALFLRCQIALCTNVSHLSDIRFGITGAHPTRMYQCGMYSYLAMHGVLKYLYSTYGNIYMHPEPFGSTSSC